MGDRDWNFTLREVLPSLLGMRPMLGEHVRARRHVVAGERFVVLHDLDSGAVARIGEREWALVASADGTRDLDGVLRAAAREGRFAGREQLETFVAALARAGMVRDADAPFEPPRDGDEVAEPPADLPVVPLAGFRFACDGRGSCCRIYPTTLLSPREVARARSLAPEILGGGDSAASAFTPERGSEPLATSPATVASVHGRCAYLDGDRRCLLHARGGGAGKPAGCRLYPLALVDDGLALRAGPVPECACVLRSARAALPEAEPLLAQDVRTRADLEPAASIRVLPARVRLHDSVTVARAAYAAWAEGAERIAGAADVPRSLWELGRRLEGARDGAELRPIPLAGELDAAPLVEAEPLVAELARVVAHIEERHETDHAWRAPDDLARLVPRWLLAAARRLRDAPALARAPASDPAGERFYVRAVAHAHLWAGARPLATELRARALRLWLARLLVAASNGEAAGDAVLDEPIALVEAVCRSYGLAP
jgi:lysine-N-methylase